MENPLKNIFKREAKVGPAMHSEAFSEYIGQPRRNVRKAIKESGRKAGGRKELNWLKNPQNWNKPEAGQFKDGNWHFFFGAASGGIVPIASWRESYGRFIFSGSWLAHDWYDINRAVLRD